VEGREGRETGGAKRWQAYSGLGVYGQDGASGGERSSGGDAGAHEGGAGWKRREEIVRKTVGRETGRSPAGGPKREEYRECGAGGERAARPR
jgi:hypothetical protein